MSSEIYEAQALEKQTARAVLMVRPVHFEFNVQTAVDNEFQHDKQGEEINRKAMEEFEKSVELLRQEGVDVLVLEAEQNVPVDIRTPDAVFPNNWFGTSHDGKIIVYTMSAENRRAETRRLPDVLQLLEKHGYVFDRQPLILQEELNKVAPSQSSVEDVLEGTGALVIDHVRGVVYAARSARCHPAALARFMKLRSEHFNKCIMFQTKSSSGKEFYHTNVMLSVGTHFAVVCSESIVQDPEYDGCMSREQVMQELSKGRTVIDITLEQAEKHFCANILEVRGADNKPRIVMSTSAYNGFTQEQRDTLSKFGKIVAFPIADAIETVGGGSSRCMLAEIFFQKSNSL
jgi:hypothetical protein